MMLKKMFGSDKMEGESSLRTEFRELSKNIEGYKECIECCKEKERVHSEDLDKVLEKLVKNNDATLKHHGVSGEIRTLVNTKRYTPKYKNLRLEDRLDAMERDIFFLKE